MNAFLNYLRRAQDDRVPYLVVRARCRNWGVPRDRAEELAEESSTVSYGRAFEQERKSPGFFTSEDHFRGWVTNSAVWQCIGELRRGNREGDLPPGDIVDPRDSAGKEETVFGMCFSRLSEVEQRILSEFAEKKTHEEIAAVLSAEFPESIRPKSSPNVPELPPTLNALRLRVFRLIERARQRLADCLTENGEPPYGLRSRLA